MSANEAIELARRGQLYPAVIVHGATAEERRQAAREFGRTLLCEAEPPARPCGRCRHCRRIVLPEDGDGFHPDFQILERDMKTVTSVDAVKAFLTGAQLSPFEARGQVFVVANAETLSGEAANALLKMLEEPPESAPRHFFLLAPSQFDLLATLRSRSLAVYLGPAEAVGPEEVADAAREFATCLQHFAASGSGVFLLAAAGALLGQANWQDARASRPWALAASAVLASLELPATPPAYRRRLLALAEALLDAGPMRLRGITAERIVEGLVSRYLVVPGAGGWG